MMPSSSAYASNDFFNNKVTTSSPQKAALHPYTSSWVSASAGSGKTKMLIDRILTLLLNGNDISHILCLTYTKAAAYEMSERLLRALSFWATTSNGEICKSVEALCGFTPDEAMIMRARTLFTNLLDTPGGLNIQTIHSFCQNILKRFPLESNLPTHFHLLDQAESQGLIETSTLKTLEDKSPEMIELIKGLSFYMDSPRFIDILMQFFSHYSRALTIMNDLVQREGEEDSVEKKIKSILQLSDDVNINYKLRNLSLLDDSAHQFFKGVPWGLYEIHLPLFFESGSKSDEKVGTILKYLIQKKHLGHSFIREDFEKYKEVFLTQAGELRKSIVTKKLAKIALSNGVDIEEFFQLHADKLCEFCETLNTLQCAQQTYFFLRLAQKVMSYYETLKQQSGALDFNDLIIKTNALLSNPDVCDWVLYKLDGGIDHILIDEAQDTNPDQWKMLSNLMQNFFRPDQPNRTLFVVGDIKQSIYSFQGANPNDFKANRSHYETLIRGSNNLWSDISLQMSYRTTEPILKFVDKLFSDPNYGQGLLLEQNALKHHIWRQDHYGCIEIWPLVTNPENADEQTNQPDSLGVGIRKGAHKKDQRELFAQTLAKQIRFWLDSGEILQSTGQTIRPEDILILVRRRTDLINLIIQACREQQIPVCESDRFFLKNHMVVRDLLSIAQFLCLPQDDFSLACILKSPFFGLSEDELLELCYNREGSLWGILKDKAQYNSRLQAIYEDLVHLLNLVDYISPYELFTHILSMSFKGYGASPTPGQVLLQGSFSYSIKDIIHEFMNQLLQFEEATHGTLQEFLYYMETNTFEIKRELGSLPQVRLMTIHGSKGLECPIVILADAADGTSTGAADPLLWSMPDHNNPNVAPFVFIRPNKQYDCALTKALKDEHHKAQCQENMRLLYVALTRAKDRLYIGGIAPKKQSSQESWYDLIKEILQVDGAQHSSAFDDYGHTFRCDNGMSPKIGIGASCVQQASQTVVLPEWLNTIYTPEKNLLNVKEKSAASDNEKNQKALEKGKILHTLFEWLIPVAPEQRQDYAKAMLENPHFELKGCETLVQQALNLMQQDHLKAFFMSDALVEVPISGMVDGVFVNGRIDRLVIRTEEIWIVDYKSDQKVPLTDSEIPIAYKKQLNQYAALLSPLYPNYKFKVFILWINNGKIMDVIF